MSFAIISNTIKMQPHHLKHSLQIVLESSLEEKPRAESAHFYNIFEGYDNLLVDWLRDIGDFRDNDYIEFDLYLSYYALLLRKFLLETIFTKNQEVTEVSYSLSFSRSFCVEEAHRVFSTQLCYKLERGYETPVVTRQQTMTF